MKNDCVSCKSMCCMAGLPYSAVLTREEADAMRMAVLSSPELRKIVDPDNFCTFDEKIGAYKMLKDASNRCVFWNPETCGCRAYSSRPLDCRIFPLEYRWFTWIHSPQCPSKNFSRRLLLAQLDSAPPENVRKLKLLHLLTPESTRDKLWMLALKLLPITACYRLYMKLKRTV